MKNQGAKKDKGTEEDKMSRHEKHPPLGGCLFGAIFHCKTGDFLRFLTQT